METRTKSLSATENYKKMYQSKFSFGTTSAIITNLGLITGLESGLNAKASIIGALLVIALADNISDSLGIHIYQESECQKTRDVWVSTITNFLSRLFVSAVFIFLVYFLPLTLAVILSILWGLLLLIIISYSIAKEKHDNPYMEILQHVAIAVVVIFISNFLGKMLIRVFNF